MQIKPFDYNNPEKFINSIKTSFELNFMILKQSITSNIKISEYNVKKISSITKTESLLKHTLGFESKSLNEFDKRSIFESIHIELINILKIIKDQISKISLKINQNVERFSNKFKNSNNVSQIQNIGDQLISTLTEIIESKLTVNLKNTKFNIMVSKYKLVGIWTNKFKLPEKPTINELIQYSNNIINSLNIEYDTTGVKFKKISRLNTIKITKMSKLKVLIDEKLNTVYMNIKKSINEPTVNTIVIPIALTTAAYLLLFKLLKSVDSNISIKSIVTNINKSAKLLSDPKIQIGLKIIITILLLCIIANLSLIGLTGIQYIRNKFLQK